MSHNVSRRFFGVLLAVAAASGAAAGYWSDLAAWLRVAAYAALLASFAWLTAEAGRRKTRARS